MYPYGTPAIKITSQMKRFEEYGEIVILLGLKKTCMIINLKMQLLFKKYILTHQKFTVQFVSTLQLFQHCSICHCSVCLCVCSNCRYRWRGRRVQGSCGDSGGARGGLSLDLPHLWARWMWQVGSLCTFYSSLR